MPSPPEPHRITVEDHQHAVSGITQTWIQEHVFALNLPLSSGAVRASRNGRVFFEGDLKPGMMRIAFPGESAETCVLSPVRYVKVGVPGEFLRRAFFQAGLRWPTTPAGFASLTRPHPTISRLATAFALAPGLEPEWQQLYMDGLTQALLTALISNNHLRLPQDGRSRNTPLDDEQFLRCCSFADARIGRRLSLDEWAGAVGMESGDFTRRFRRRTKESPYSWFLNRRIEYAKHLLLEEKLSLRQIAIRAGFSSQSHFTEAFRNRVGCSPLRWRVLPAFVQRADYPEQ
jgi:AraC family transcriptional regulator